MRLSALSPTNLPARLSNVSRTGPLTFCPHLPPPPSFAGAVRRAAARAARRAACAGAPHPRPRSAAVGRRRRAALPGPQARGPLLRGQAGCRCVMRTRLSNSLSTPLVTRVTRSETNPPPPMGQGGLLWFTLSIFCRHWPPPLLCTALFWTSPVDSSTCSPPVPLERPQFPLPHTLPTASSVALA